MNFRHVTLQVKDLQASLFFYQNIIGLPVVRHIKAENNRELVFLGNPGQTQIELIYAPNAKEETFSPNISLGFDVDSCEDTIAMLKQHNIELVGDIVTLSPNTRFFFVQDPNGLRIQFMGK